jgi:hypothetical protein
VQRQLLSAENRDVQLLAAEARITSPRPNDAKLPENCTASAGSDEACLTRPRRCVWCIWSVAIDPASGKRARALAHSRPAAARPGRVAPLKPAVCWASSFLASGPGFFLPLVTARYTAVTAATAGYGNGTQR